METIISLVGDIPLTGVIAIVAALLISVALQYLKKWLSIQSEKIMVFSLGTLSFMASAFDTLSSKVAENPTVLGPKTMALMGLATAVYHYAVKPATLFMRDVKAARDGVVANPDVATPEQIADIVSDTSGEFAPEQ